MMPRARTTACTDSNTIRCRQFQSILDRWLILAIQHGEFPRAAWRGVRQVACVTRHRTICRGHDGTNANYWCAGMQLRQRPHNELTIAQVCRSCGRGQAVKHGACSGRRVSVGALMTQANKKLPQPTKATRCIQVAARRLWRARCMASAHAPSSSIFSTSSSASNQSLSLHAASSERISALIGAM